MSLNKILRNELSNAQYFTVALLVFEQKTSLYSDNIKKGLNIYLQFRVSIHQDKKVPWLFT